MKKYGKSGRSGKRRRNMPGYRLGIDRIGRKAWLVNRRPEDIAGRVSKSDFLNGKIEVGSIFAISKKSNGIFLGIHRGRILYYNPKTDRVSHTGFGRGDQNTSRIIVLKEKTGLDYFKSENNWMNHRKIPGSDLKVSDILTNPYRKTIVKKVGDEFTMLDYHETAVVGDILQGNQSDLKAEVISITKKGFNVKVDDGTPHGKLGYVDLKNPKYRDRKYTLVKSAINDDLQVEDLQKKIDKLPYSVVDTDKNGTVAVSRRGRPAGSTNRILTEEEKQVHRDKMNDYVKKIDEMPDDDLQGQIDAVKKIISHANKSGETKQYEKHKKLLQQLSYKKRLHDKYEEAGTDEDKLESAKAALKYERRIGGRDSAIQMWQDRINKLNGIEDIKPDKEKDDSSNKKDLETENKKEDRSENREKGFEEKIAEYIEKYKDENDFKDGYKERELAAYYSDEKLNSKLKEYTDILKNNPDENKIANLIGSYKAIKDSYDERESIKKSLDEQAERYANDPEFKDKYENRLNFLLKNRNSVEIEKALLYTIIELSSIKTPHTDQIKNDLAIYKAYKDALSKVDKDKDAIKYKEKLDLEFASHRFNVNFVNQAKIDIRKNVLLNEDYLKRELENSLRDLKDNDFAFSSAGGDYNLYQELDEKRKKLLIRFKALESLLAEKSQQVGIVGIEKQLENAKNHPDFINHYQEFVKILTQTTIATTKKEQEEILNNTIESLQTINSGALGMNTTAIQATTRKLLAQYSAIKDLMGGKIKQVYQQTLDNYLSDNNISKSHPSYSKYLGKYQSLVIAAVKKGADVSDDIKKTIPMFNTWNADPLSGSDIRERIKKLKISSKFINDIGRVIPEISEDDTYENVISKLNNEMKRLLEEKDGLDLFKTNLNAAQRSIALTKVKREIGDLKFYIENANTYYDASISKMINEHLNSFEPCKIDYTIRFENDNIVPQTRTNAERAIKNGIEFIKRMLGKRQGDFSVGFLVNTTNTTYRAGYYDRDREVKLGRFDGEPVAIHELAHMMEYLYPQAKNMCVDFIKRRTQGEALKKMSELFPDHNYRDSELVRPDNFIHPYIGKLYLNDIYDPDEVNKWDHDTPNEKIRSTEVLSMGLQYMYEKPSEFLAKDPEHFDLVWNIMRGGGKWQ